MKKLNKVIVATDFSAGSDFALKMANRLKEKSSCSVTLVHISDAATTWDWPGTDLQALTLLEQFRKELTTAIEKKIKDQMVRCGVDFEAELIFGEAYSEMMNFIERSKADLIVMGHRGEKSIFPIGSFAKKMIASSAIPVLITNNETPINKVGCLLDLSKIMPFTITAGRDFAQMFNAHLSYFTSIPDLSTNLLTRMPFAISNTTLDENQRKEIISKAKNELIKNLGQVNEDDIIVDISIKGTSASLSEKLDEHNIDLAVLGKHNRGPLEKLFIGSVSSGFIDYFKGNSLILPENKGL